MSYVSLYRKWRPRTFDEIIGQEHVVRTLKNAVATGRITHAYLFAGPRGTGKTSTARVLSRALNCEHGPTPDPCGKCASCVAISEGNAMDIIEIDAASNRGIDEMRDLREKVVYAPTLGRYKVYIIDEAHMLTTPAFNALLKTLEEPPAHAIFILATTEAENILPTIVSRCQRFDFTRLTADDLSTHIRRVAAAQSISIDPEAALLIARRAEGCVRDALGLLEQASAWDEHVTVDSVLQLLGVSDFQVMREFADAVIQREPGPMLRVIQQAVDGGADPRQFLQDLVGHFRNLLVAKECPGSQDLIDVQEAAQPILIEQAQRLSRSEIIRALGILSEGEQDAKRSGNPRLSAELTAARLCAPVPPAPPEPPAAPLWEPSQVQAPSQAQPRTSAQSGAAAVDLQAGRHPSGTEGAARPASPATRAGAATRRSSERAAEMPRAGDSGAGPACEPVGGPGSDDGGMFSGITQAQWDQMLAGIKARSIPLDALLKQVARVSLDGDALSIIYPQDWSVLAQKISEPRNKEIMASVAAEVLGRAITCQASAGQVSGGSRSSGGGGSAGQGGDFADSPEVQRAIDVFNPREVRVINK